MKGEWEEGLAYGNAICFQGLRSAAVVLISVLIKPRTTETLSQNTGTSQMYISYGVCFTIRQ